MTDLLDSAQVLQIRQAFRDISDTFAFPIIIRTTFYSTGAYQTAPTTVDIPTVAIRDFVSSSESNGQYRNNISVQDTGEFDIYIHWDKIKELRLADELDGRPLLHNNDLVVMEGEVYEILYFGTVADMTKEPAFLKLKIKRRFEDPNGADYDNRSTDLPGSSSSPP